MPRQSRWWWVLPLLGFLVAIPGLVLYFADSDLANFFLPMRALARNGALLGSLLIGIGAVRQGLRNAPIRSAAALFLAVFAVWIHASLYSAYQERAVEFESQGERMRGTLYLPDDPGPYPLVVIAQGSLPAPRAIYHFWADHLVRRGIAVYSFDKRGTGQSGGTYQSDNNASETNLRLLASDVSAAVDALSAAGRYDFLGPDLFRGGIGVFGISMGGWLGPIAASQNDAISYLVLLSGPTVSVGEENFYSDLAGDNYETEQLASVAKADSLTRLEGPSGFDPRPVLANLNIPALWLLGLEDTSIPSRMTADVVDSLRAGGRPFEYRMYPAADHLGFEQAWPYDVTPGLLDDAAAWIHARAGTKGTR